MKTAVRDLKFEKDVQACNLVFLNSENYYIGNIMRLGVEEVVVLNKTTDNVVYNFGSLKEYSKMITRYAELPCKFIFNEYNEEEIVKWEN